MLLETLPPETWRIEPGEELVILRTALVHHPSGIPVISIATDVETITIETFSDYLRSGDTRGSIFTGYKNTYEIELRVP